jgi:hypothetical protein
VPSPSTCRPTSASSTSAASAAAHRLPQPPNRWLTLSLFIGTLLAATPPPRDGGLGFLVMATLLALSLRWDIGPLALLGLFAVGVELRYFSFGAGISGVADVTRGAIDVMLRGGNPYGIGYDPTRPLAEPFPYGPLALLWYLPWKDPRVLELIVSNVIMAALMIRGRPLGLAIWATSPMLIQLASDGSNDDSAGLLLLVALVVLERMPRAGAALIGIAAAFKIYALAWLPPIFVWAGAGALAAGVVATALGWLPAVVLWGAGPILQSFQLSDATHQVPYYSLGQALQQLGMYPDKGLLNTFRLAAGGVTTIISSALVRSHAGVVIAGMLIYLVTLYAGFWSTAAYLTAIGAVLCWYLDVWLAPGREARVRWPGDPVGRLTAWVDQRWPRVEPGWILGAGGLGGLRG